MTVMTYLSDVQAGGGTAFPAIGVKSEAENGAALLWVNLKTAGQKDRLTLHGGCPVLVGSKWITNKWIRFNDQFAKFRCTLDLHEQIDFYGHYKTY